MKKEYNFSGGIRGIFYQPENISNESLKYLLKQTREEAKKKKLKKSDVKNAIKEARKSIKDRS